MEVAHHFEQVFTSVEIGVRKPTPAIFQHALEALGIQPEGAVYIGDSHAADYQGATSAGLKCILIDHKREYLEVPHRVESLFELEKHL
jgi:putative hydrolase of the HAD superfamily